MKRIPIGLGLASLLYLLFLMQPIFFNPIWAQTTTATAIVLYDNIGLFNGPSSDYEQLAKLTKDQSCVIDGRNPDSSWWQVTCAGRGEGWVAAGLVVVQGNPLQIPVVESVPPPAPVYRDWQTFYFASPDLAGLPAATADEPQINFDWGLSGPRSNLPADEFSARFNQTIDFLPGRYRLLFKVNGGLRVWLDDRSLIDAWQTVSANSHTADRVLNGPHQLRIEYVNRKGPARIQFLYGLLRSEEDWRVVYFANPDLTGESLLTRFEPRLAFPIDQEWGDAPPGEGLPSQGWSARWSGRYIMQAGPTRFTVRSSGPVRLLVDDQPVITSWTDVDQIVEGFYTSPGRRAARIVLEFAETNGPAALQLSWQRDLPSRDE